MKNPHDSDRQPRSCSQGIPSLREMIPIQLPPKQTVSVTGETQRLERTLRGYLEKAVKSGAAGADEVKTLLRDLNQVSLAVSEIEKRLRRCVSEGIDKGDIVSLAYTWRQETRKFLEMRDAIFEAVNSMVLSGIIRLEVGDRIKGQADRIYDFFLEFAEAVEAASRRVMD